MEQTQGTTCKFFFDEASVNFNMLCWFVRSCWTGLRAILIAALLSYYKGSVPFSDNLNSSSSFCNHEKFTNTLSNSSIFYLCTWSSNYTLVLISPSDHLSSYKCTVTKCRSSVILEIQPHLHLLALIFGGDPVSKKIDLSLKHTLETAKCERHLSCIWGSWGSCMNWLNKLTE